MAVVALKSVPITNRDATPRVINDGRLERGTSKSVTGWVTTGAADSIASIYTLLSLPSTAIVQQLYLTNGAVTSAAANIGVYRPTNLDGTAGAVVSVSLFAAAVSLAAAATNTDVTNQSTNYTIAKQDQPLWQAAGLTADPGGTLDISVTLTAAATASAIVKLLCFYVDNGS